MGEEFPLDPNKVQPPQEGQLEQPQEGDTTHIEVNSHEGEAQLGEVALSNDFQESETHENERSSDDEPTHLSSIDHDDNSTKLSPKEEQKSPGRIRNKDKAETMARAENLYGHYGYKPDGGAWHRRVNAGSIEDSVQKAGDEYEVGEIAERDGKSPEEVKKLLFGNRKAFFDYSRAMIENQKQYGDKLSPNHIALEAVHELADRYPNLIKDGHLESRDMSISIRHSRISGGALDIDIDHHTDQEGNIYQEGWVAPAFNSVSSWRKYEATSYSTEDPNFDSATITKRRSMREEDAQRLKDLLTDANFDPEPVDDYDHGHDDEDDEPISTSEIQRRAIASMGNTEQAREAARDFPGDFM